MTDSEALERLSGITYNEIVAVWGEPVWSFSGLFGGGWQYDGKEVTLDFRSEDISENDIFKWPVYSVYIRDIPTK